MYILVLIRKPEKIHLLCLFLCILFIYSFSYKSHIRFGYFSRHLLNHTKVYERDLGKQKLT
jgi:hypothetical protein